ncbi:MAG: GtrA family protein [Coprobacter sp.]|nr:GtrA family protein [Coprobacter sp.]
MLTTVVDLAVYYFLLNLLSINYLLAQAISWVAAVLSMMRFTL